CGAAQVATPGEGARRDLELPGGRKATPGVGEALGAHERLRRARGIPRRLPGGTGARQVAALLEAFRRFAHGAQAREELAGLDRAAGLAQRLGLKAAVERRVHREQAERLILVADREIGVDRLAHLAALLEESRGLGRGRPAALQQIAGLGALALLREDPGALELDPAQRLFRRRIVPAAEELFQAVRLELESAQRVGRLAGPAVVERRLAVGLRPLEVAGGAPGLLQLERDLGGLGPGLGELEERERLGSLARLREQLAGLARVDVLVACGDPAEEGAEREVDGGPGVLQVGGEPRGLKEVAPLGVEAQRVLPASLLLGRRRLFERIAEQLREQAAFGHLGGRIA